MRCYEYLRRLLRVITSRWRAGALWRLKILKLIGTFDNYQCWRNNQKYVGLYFCEFMGWNKGTTRVYGALLNVNGRTEPRRQNKKDKTK